MKRTTKTILAIGTMAAAAGSFAPAHAASTETWDSIAQCESGGNWGINTGNGFSGGLQFTQQTWNAFGGQGSAQNASKTEQIKVAEKVLSAQGWGAWPACSSSLGLHGGSGGTPEHQNVATSATSTVQTSRTTTQSYSTPTQTYSAPIQNTTDNRNAVVHYAPSLEQTYTVKSGDTIGKIAKAHHVDWHKLYQANKNHIHNVNLIFPGQVLTIPSK